MNDIRSLCGRLRLTYRPDWSVETPWMSYTEGTAHRLFATLREALAFYEAREFRFPSTSVRTRYRAYVARRKAYGFTFDSFRDWVRWNVTGADR